jgi:hypothetical protein
MKTMKPYHWILIIGMVCGTVLIIYDKLDATTAFAAFFPFTLIVWALFD